MRSSAEFTDEFVRVSRAFPCLQCGRDSWCVVHRSGEYGLCQRVESGRRCGDAGWRYEIEDPVEPPRREPTTPLQPWQIGIEYQRCMAAVTDGQLAELSDDLHVSKASIKRLGVGWCEDRKAYAIPMRDGSGGLTGLQFRTPQGRKFSLPGSKLGLFLPEGLPFRRWLPLFVAEGASDCAALLDQRVAAVGRAACHVGADHIRQLLVVQKPLPSQVVVVSDNDAPGILGAKKFASAFDAVVMKPRRCKDARATIVDGGGRRDIFDTLYGKHNDHWELLRD